MSAFNVLLLRISDELSVDQLEKMKFLCLKDIGKGRMERTDSGIKLFQLLKERNKLGHGNTEFLKFLLTEIGKLDLVEKINNYDSQSTGSLDNLPDAEEIEKLDIATRMITANLGRRWRVFGRNLGLSEAKLDHVSEKHPFNLEEKVVELLKEWRKIQKAEAKTEDLIKALRSCRLNYTADLVQKELEKANGQ